MSNMSTTASANQNSVLLIGGPDAGKSNFLFRLWIAIDCGGGALVKDGLPSQVEYLREGAERLLEGEFAPRTSKVVDERVVIPIKSIHPELKASGALIVPDVSGEQILTICRNRQWSQSWESLISEQCGCLIFVRAGSDEVVAPLDWVTSFEKYGGILDGKTSNQPIDSQMQNDEQDAQESEPPVQPTQVVLTEWLQFLRLAFTDVVSGSCKPRVGVVVSAWDAVPIDQQKSSPFQYLRDNFPMLHQFIESNNDRFDFQVFGVSIVNGDLKNDKSFRENYLNGRPQEYGLVVHTLSGRCIEESPDITLPVAWAVGLFLAES